MSLRLYYICRLGKMPDEKFVEYTRRIHRHLRDYRIQIFANISGSLAIRDTFRKLSFPPLSRERAQTLPHVRRLTRMMFTDLRSSRKVLILPRILPKDASRSPRLRTPRHCTANLQKRFRFSPSGRGICSTNVVRPSARAVRGECRETFRGKLEIAE